MWCNYHLKSSNVEISDIVTDFANGVNFAMLIQALTKKTIKINENPRTHQEKLENLRGAFSALESVGAKPQGCSPEGKDLKFFLAFFKSLDRLYQWKCEFNHRTDVVACWKIQGCF